MAFAAGHYKLNMSALPARSEGLQARFSMTANRKGAPLLLLHPSTGPVREPSLVRYATGLVLKLADGTVAGNSGQLVVTGERLIGMITDGSAGGARLDATAGSVYAFTVDRDDIGVTTRDNWRGKPVEVVIRSRDGQQPSFLIQVFSLVASVKDNGSVAVGSLPNLLRWLSPAGRKSLRDPS